MRPPPREEGRIIKELVFDCRLKFGEHIDEKINRAYQMLGIIKRNFIHLTPDSFVVLCEGLRRFGVFLLVVLMC